MKPETVGMLAMAEALAFGSGMHNGHIHIPQSDWRHSDERKRKAEEKAPEKTGKENQGLEMTQTIEQLQARKGK